MSNGSPNDGGSGISANTRVVDAEPPYYMKIGLSANKKEIAR